MRPTVGIMAASYPPNIGGYEHVISRMALSLADHGLAVHVYTHVQAPESSPGIAVHSISALGLVGGFFPIPTPLGIVQLFRAVRASGPDILVTNTRFFLLNLAATVLARMLSIPVVHIEHGAGPVRVEGGFLQRLANLYDRTLGRIVVSRAAVACGISPASRAFLRDLGAESPKAIHVPYDLTPFLRQGPSEGNGESKELLFVGRLIYGKGLRDFLLAVGRIKDEFPEVRVSVIGGGPDEDRLRAISAPLGCVTFEGPLGRGDLADRYARAAAVVYPSYTEGLGLVPLEAGASGVPLIATRSGGPDSWLLTPHRAYLVQPGDVEGLAQAIRRVLRHPGEARAKATSLQQAVREHESEARWIEEWTNLTEKILA